MAKLSTAERNNLPDSAFAYIEAGGTQDAGGKTTPRSLRHFPVHDAAHVRDALARIAGGAEFGEKALPKVKAAARKFGIQVDGGQSAADRAAFELRKRRRSSMTRQAERRGLQIEMRSQPDGTGGTDFVFEGYAAVFDSPFGMWDRWGEPYTEVVKPGAFTATLSRPDLDVPFLIGHDDKRLALARTRNGTMRLAQDSRGLHVLAHMDGRRSDVRDLAYAVERGDTDEMSIGFVTLGQAWSDDYETRSMLELDLHRGDVSSVPLAANPAAAGASMTALPTEILSRPAAELRAAVNAAADASHPPFTGTHSHAHPAYGAAADNALHTHQHEHNGDNDHHHHQNASLAVADAGDLSASGPREHRANPVDQDLGDASDYNVSPHGPMTGTHSHAHPGDAEGHAHPHAHDGDDDHGHEHLYDMAGRARLDDSGWGGGGDALVRLDEAGIPAMTEEQGAAASLALRRRQLELLKLAPARYLEG